MRQIKNIFLELPGYDCFGCAPQNPFGLKLKFFFDDEKKEIVSYLKDTDHFHGFPGVLHGGIQATLLDELGFWLIYDQIHKFAFTTNMEVKYKNVIQVPDELTIRSKIVSHKEKTVVVEGKIFTGDGKIATEGKLFFYLSDKKMWERLKGDKDIPETFLPYL